MADSETTKRQKLRDLDMIEQCVIYIKTHGLECVNGSDLRAAARALDAGTDVVVPRA